MLAKLIRALAARWVTAYLMLTYALFVALLAAWSTISPAQRVAGIASLSPFWLLYLIAGVHLLACTIQFFASVRRRATLSLPEDRAGTAVTLTLNDETLAPAAKRAGMKCRWLDKESVAVLYRHRFSSVGTLLFHGALLLLPLAYVISGATRFEGKAWIIEGHTFEGKRAEYYRVTPTEHFSARAPKVHFETEAVEATFWQKKLFFTDLRALLITGKGAERQAAWATMAQPVWIDGARISIQGFNYTPSVEVLAPTGQRIQEADLNLRLFPPGVEDSFTLPGLPHRFWVRLYPDDRGFQLGKPVFHLAVTRGKRLVSRGWLRRGEHLAFDGFRIAFPAIRRGGEIVVHRDWGYPLLWAILMLALLGIAWRVLAPSCIVWLVKKDNGSVEAIVREDAFARGRAERLLANWRADKGNTDAR